ncbi:MAG: hypothetical protein JW810_08700 [Sedimentisphaerales bacterium]|nr:hypothetical protein [Sedimentisphaerales bacterium]
MAKEPSEDHSSEPPPENPDSKSSDSPEPQASSSDSEVPTAMPADIDSLLDMAADSLDLVDGELTETKSDKPDTADKTNQAKATPPGPTPPQKPELAQEVSTSSAHPPVQPEAIDRALTNLESQMESLRGQLLDEEAPPAAGLPDADPARSTDAAAEGGDEASAESPAAQTLAEADVEDDESETVSQNQLDDILAGLAEEVGQVDEAPPPPSGQADSARGEPAGSLEQDAVADGDADAEIDEILSQVETIGKQEHAADADPTPPADSPPDDAGAEAGPADAVQVPSAGEEPAADLPDPPDSDHSEDPPEAAGPSPAEESTATADDDDDFDTPPMHSEDKDSAKSKPAKAIPVAVDDEGKVLSQDEQKPEEPAEPDSGLSPEVLGQFSLPERALIRGACACNKPFEFLPDRVRDIMGLVGVITVLISILAAALILLLK